MCPPRMYAEQLDRRSSEIFDELADALLRHAAATVRAALAEPGSAEQAHADEATRQLSTQIAQLERALVERPWTEAAS